MAKALIEEPGKLSADLSGKVTVKCAKGERFQPLSPEIHGRARPGQEPIIRGPVPVEQKGSAGAVDWTRPSDGLD